MPLLDQKLSEIHDPSVLELIQELSAIRHVPRNPLIIFRQFLLQIFHPTSVTKRVRIKKHELQPAGLLIQKLKAFPETEIFALCKELIGDQAGSLEAYYGKSIYTILNDFGPDLTGKRQQANRITLQNILDSLPED
jgi:hypothetical protein